MKSLSGRLLTGLFAIGAAGLLAQNSLAAQSDGYPSRPVRLLVGFVPGGGTDVTARAISHKLGERLGQPVITDNRAGAGGAIAREIVRNAQPDGHTLILLTSSQVVNANLIQKDPVDIRDAFAHITALVSYPYLMVAHPASPIKTVKELIAYAKSKPGSLDYGTPGIGTTAHLGTELLNHMAGVNLVHVPFKGSGDVIRELISGRLQISFASAISSIPHLKSGKLRVIAVSSGKRSTYLPDVPSVAEGGLPGYEFTGWYSMAAPPRTPLSIVMRLNKEIGAVLETPEAQKNFAADIAEAEHTTPERLRAKIDQELKKWGGLLATTGLKL